MIYLRYQSFKFLSRLANTISQNPRLLPPLEALKKLNLSESWMGAGIIRNCIWDALHQTESNLMEHDVDVIFYDESDISKTREQTLEEQLRLIAPQYLWSVKNQARMKIVHQKAYNNCWEALAHWPETATCIAARIGKNGEVETLAPYGTDDLFDLILRPTPYINRDVFINRVLTKKWLIKWPKLRMIL